MNKHHLLMNITLQGEDSYNTTPLLECISSNTTHPIAAAYFKIVFITSPTLGRCNVVYSNVLSLRFITLKRWELLFCLLFSFLLVGALHTESHLGGHL